MAIHTDHLRTLAIASRHGLSQVATNANAQFILQVAVALVEVEKILKEEAEKANAPKAESVPPDHA